MAEDKTDKKITKNKTKEIYNNYNFMEIALANNLAISFSHHQLTTGTSREKMWKEGEQ